MPYVWDPDKDGRIVIVTERRRLVPEVVRRRDWKILLRGSFIRISPRTAHCNLMLTWCMLAPAEERAEVPAPHSLA